MRNILLLLLLLVAGKWLMNYQQRRQVAARMRDGAEKNQTNRDASRAAREALPPAERMVQCAQCGTYLPESEALRGANDLHFCCADHRHAFAGRML